MGVSVAGCVSRVGDEVCKERHTMRMAVTDTAKWQARDISKWHS
jgi:hypothetical protein